MYQDKDEGRSGRTITNEMMKILITGTAGFIGFHLVKKLLERGDTVVGIDNIND